MEDGFRLSNDLDKVTYMFNSAHPLGINRQSVLADVSLKHHNRCQHHNGVNQCKLDADNS